MVRSYFGIRDSARLTLGLVDIAPLMAAKERGQKGEERGEERASSGSPQRRHCQRDAESRVLYSQVRVIILEEGEGGLVQGIPANGTL